MEKHFNTIKNSDLTFDTSFYNEVAKAVGQKDFVVRGCLTWSLNHQFEKPATVETFPLIDEVINQCLQWRCAFFSRSM